MNPQTASFILYDRFVQRKVIKLTEADGDTEDQIIFQLEKNKDEDYFSIVDDNPWINVKCDGTITVKNKWDFDQLPADKKINFMVHVLIQSKGNYKYRYSFINMVGAELCKAQHSKLAILQYMVMDSGQPTAQFKTTSQKLAIQVLQLSQLPQTLKHVVWRCRQ